MNSEASLALIYIWNRQETIFYIMSISQAIQLAEAIEG